MARDDVDGSASRNLHRVPRHCGVIRYRGPGGSRLRIRPLQKEAIEQGTEVENRFRRKMTEGPEKTWVLDLIESKKPTSTSCSSSLAY